MVQSLQAAIERLMFMDHAKTAQLTRDNVREWMIEAVVPVVEGLLRRQDFRKQARWSVEHLVQGAAGEARESVEAVDRALVRYALAMAEFGQLPEAHAVLRRTWRLPGTQCREEDSDGLRGARDVARRPWQDLVSARDYLFRQAGLNLQVAEAGHPHGQFADFVPAFRQALRAPGDCVADMALRRVAFWQEWLKECGNRCRDASGNCTAAAASYGRVRSTGEELQQAISELQVLLTTGSAAKLRHACASLVQAYAAYHPRPDLDRLDLPASTTGRGELAFWLERGDYWIAYDIAGAVGTVAQMYQRDLTMEERVEEAAQTYRLALGSEVGARYVFWEKRPIGAKWIKDPAMWGLFETLALCRSRGRGVDCDDCGHDLSEHALACRVSRLKEQLPKNLASQIESATEYAYELALEPHEIFVYPVVSKQVANFQDLLAQVGPGIGKLNGKRNKGR